MSTSNPYSDKVEGYEAGTACTETGISALTDNSFAVYDTDTEKMVSAPFTYESSAILPWTTATYNLGSEALAFSFIYGNKLASAASTPLYLGATSGTGYLQSGSSNVFAWNGDSLYPTTNLGASIGSSSNKLESVYANSVRTVNVVSTSSLVLVAPSGDDILAMIGSTPIVYFNEDGIVPYTSDTSTLGASDYLWSNTYTDTVTGSASSALVLNSPYGYGVLQLAGTSYYEWSAGGFYPLTTASYSSGLVDHVWSVVYTNAIQSAASTNLVLNPTATGVLQSNGTNYAAWNSTALYPTTTSSYQLGAVGSVWSACYVDTIYSSTTSTLMLNGPSGVYFEVGSSSSRSNYSLVAHYDQNSQIIIGSDGIEIGNPSRTATSTPYIDFHSSTYGNDYDVRLLASGGNSGSSGSGSLTVNASAGVSIDGPTSFNSTITVGNSTSGSTIYMYTSNGSRYLVTVSTSGVLTATSG